MRELRLDLASARRDLLLVELEKFRCLAQLEQMLCRPAAFQRADYRRRVRFAVGMAQGSEGAGVALPDQDGPDDRQAGAAGDAAYDVSELHVHQLEGFLHVLNMLAGAGLDFLPNGITPHGQAVTNHIVAVPETTLLNGYRAPFKDRPSGRGMSPGTGRGCATLLSSIQPRSGVKTL